MARLVLMPLAGDEQWAASPTRATRPRVPSCLAEGVEEQRCVIECGEHARRLPAGLRERAAQDGDHGVAVEILEQP